MSKWYPCIYCTEDLHCTKYSDDDSESWCVLGPCTAETPSNADKMRQMSDEELARQLAFLEDFNYDESRVLEWLDWLRQEAQPNAYY